MADSEEYKRYESCLKEAVHNPWWVEFVSITRTRRLRFMEELATSINKNQREEDVLRGQISESNFVIALDAYAQEQFKPKGGSDART